jgi:hypothetical protein
MLESNCHGGEILLGKTNNSLFVNNEIENWDLIDIAESSLLDAGVFDDFTEDTTISSADNENFFRIGMGIHS